MDDSIAGVSLKSPFHHRRQITEAATLDLSTELAGIFTVQESLLSVVWLVCSHRSHLLPLVLLRRAP